MRLPPAADLSSVLERDLPPPLLEALRKAVSVANEAGVACYLVGGPVRDLLLGRPIDDLDLVLEGDAIAVADRFARITGGTLTCHDAFRTATVVLISAGQPFHIDFVTARSESYPAPAALPVVRPSTIEDDLRRRDFTINTLALTLADPGAARLLDVCGGLPDLERRLIRVLHSRSFIDDPTRILRAARFAARLDFAIEEQTDHLIVEAVHMGMIERTSPARILNELWLTFAEPASEEVLALLHAQGVLARAFPTLQWTPELKDRIRAVRSMSVAEDERRLLILGLIAWAMSPAGRDQLADYYPFTTAERRLIAETSPLAGVIETLAQRRLRASELDRLLHTLSEIIRMVGEVVAPPAARAQFVRYREALQPIRTLLNGDDLRALSIPPGPHYRTLLQDLRAAQLDGEITTRAEAEQWVLKQGHDRQTVL